MLKVNDRLRSLSVALSNNERSLSFGFGEGSAAKGHDEQGVVVLIETSPPITGLKRSVNRWGRRFAAVAGQYY